MQNYNIEPGFVPGVAGSLYKMDVFPLADVRAQVLYLPPHGEELNRCRSVVAAHARSFAKCGVACRVLDYFGAGDSDGDFSDGTWDIWLKDVAAQVNDFKALSDEPVYLAGFRLGALLALSHMNEPLADVQGALLVQPVTQGKQYVNQLLRQRIAGQLGSGESETTEMLKAQIAAGRNLEIGGYIFGSQLLTDLEQQSLKLLDKLTNYQLFWLEFEGAKDKGLSIGSQRAVKTLQEQGNTVTSLAVFDPPIWQLHERAKVTECVQVIEKVVQQW